MNDGDEWLFDGRPTAVVLRARTAKLIRSVRCQDKPRIPRPLHTRFMKLLRLISRRSISRSRSRKRAPILAVAAALVTGCAAARRQVPESVTGRARGFEESAGFRLPPSSDTAWMEVFVPAGVSRIRAVVAIMERDGFFRYAFDDRDWRAMCPRIQCALVRIGLPNEERDKPALQFIRNAALGGDSAVFTALRIAGERTRHPKLEKAGLVVFGLSASGNFGPTFAARHPDRTIGFVRYHSHLRGIPVDTVVLARIPSLSVVGTTEREADIVEDTKALWAVLRRRAAPVGFTLHLGQPDVSIDGFDRSGICAAGMDRSDCPPSHNTGCSHALETDRIATSG